MTLPKKKGTYSYGSTGGPGHRNASANYCGPKTDRLKNVITAIYYLKQQVMFRPNLWAALQVKHIDLKERGSSGM